MKHQTDLQAPAFPATRRVDPAALPARFLSPDIASGAERSVMLDTDRVVMARRLGKLAMNIELPVQLYRGVSLRIVPGATEAEDRMQVVLIHPDQALDLTLFEAEDDADIIAEWRLWAVTLNLPLLIEGLDGHAVATENRFGGLVVADVRPRRRHAFLKDRRTRFASRRRTGRATAGTPTSSAAAANDN
ncbi:DUF6101 family protein [Terrihabitans rhizophilus]|uniref:DUF6101 family protein n=1 Tax=Terrihabitans rhizophilus TaxID=3092662 RepID=A0ABU4RTD2_9HYPH|nr:DUF6101 family protein [Terrihabitans sp. PJ23]MDX6806895.1 DUF6101 family protein [Terrihabitans sp. PJ23]